MEDDGYELDNEPAEESAELIDGMLALHLSNLAVSSRIGAIDRGFPRAYGQLAAVGLAEKKSGGYVITPAGISYLKDRRRRKPNE